MNRITNGFRRAALASLAALTVGAPCCGGGDFTSIAEVRDLRADKTWKFKSWQLSFYVDIQNVYNHGNTEGLSYNYNYTKREFVTGLPFLPSIGLRGEL